MTENLSQYRWLLLAHASGLRFLVLGALSAYLLGAYSGSTGFDLRLETLLPWLTILITPALGMGPFAAAIANSRARSQVLFIATLVGLLALALFAMLQPSAWFRCFGLLICETGVFIIARNASFASDQPRLYWSIKLSHVLSVGGAVLGVWLVWAEVTGESTPKSWSFAPYAVLCYAIALGLAYFGKPTPTGEPFLKESPMVSFVAGTRESFGARYYLRLFLSAILFWAIVGILFIVVPRIESYSAPEHLRAFYGQRIPINLGLGMLLGTAIILLQQHEYRAGFGIPVSFFLIGIAGLLRSIYGVSAGVYVLAGVGMGVGWVSFSLWSSIWGSRRFAGTTAALGLLSYALGGILAGAVTFWAIQNPKSASDTFTNIWLWVGLPLGVLMIVIWFRTFFEFMVSVCCWPLYRITAIGPGTNQMPLRGPYLVFANHAAWLDPLFVDKIVPAPTIPLMTSKFYDLPVISFLMRRVIGTIRVEDTTLKRETPEIPQAIEALNKGECVIIFPEGWLRRKESQPLKRFGRGIWQILVAKPDTLIVPMWIEGNWGSYTSFKDGKPPMKGKKPDFWKTIKIGVGEPLRIDPEILKDHMQTRTYLQNQVLKARELLGLPALNTQAESSSEEGKE